MGIKRRTYCFILLFFLHGIALPALFSQEKYPIETIDMFSDRNVYISGENIFFSGLISLSNDSVPFSKLVYIELVSPNGQKIEQAKIKIHDSTFEGNIEIPASLISGYYFIRAYSKWMRNGSPYAYTYKLIQIINPYSIEVNGLPDSLILIDQKNSIKTKYSDLFSISKNEFKKGDTMLLSANEDEDYKKASISIIPMLSNPYFEESKKHGSLFYDTLLYFPETRGLSLSGIVRDKISKEAVAYHKVNIRLKNEKDFVSAISDSAGHFYILLPERYGEIELLIISSKLDNKELELIIDQDFCTKKIALEVPSFSIYPNDKENILTMAQRAQLASIYYESKVDTIPFKPTRPFYGKAFLSFELKDYIELDSLAQYFTDLPCWIDVKKENGKRKLLLSGSEGELKIYPPLILVDWLPVNDVEAVLKISPSRIKEFEVIAKPYIHGDILYGGVISIKTQKGDFGGLAFPESAAYLNVKFYGSNSIHPSKRSEMDFRNTFFWEPSIEKNKSKTFSLELPTDKGDYQVLIQTINKDGELKVQKLPFSIN